MGDVRLLLPRPHGDTEGPNPSSSLDADPYHPATDATGRKYKLLPETVHVTVRSIIQEQDLEFMRGGSETGDSVLPDDQHARLMTHNFENYL